MSIRFRCLLLALTLVTLAGCTGTDPRSVTPVVGLADGAVLYEGPELMKEKARLDAGATVTVLTKKDKAFEIKTQSGQQGWVPRYAICTQAEWERRKAENQAPKIVVCIGSDGGRTFMYGGSISIGNGGFVMKPGDAYWLDESMTGKAFTLGSERVTGDPAILWLNTEKEGVVKLPLWDSVSKQ